MDEERLVDVVAMAYEAASGGSTWLEFGTSLCGLLGAQRSTLRLVDGSLTNLLAPGDQADRGLSRGIRWQPPPGQGTKLTPMEATIAR
jgi:hypothetical protein